MTLSQSNSPSNGISDSPVLLVVVALCGGITLDRWVDFSFETGLAISLFGLLFWWLIFWRFKRRRWGEAAASVALLVSIAGLGASWHHGRWNWFPDQDISQFAGDWAGPVCVRAKIRSEPRPMAFSEVDVLNPIPSRPRTRLRIEPEQIRNGNRWQAVSGCCELIVHDECRDLRVGDQVIIFGSLVRISPPSNPGQFSFHEYSRSQSRLAVVHAYFSSSVRVERSEDVRSNGWVLATIRRRFNDLVWEYVGPNRAPLASAILLGNREQLTPARREEFMQTGTVHLLAISGLHVGILAGAFFLLFRFGFSSRRWALLSTIAFVLFYAWLVEFRTPVTRATILLVLVYR